MDIPLDFGVCSSIAVGVATSRRDAPPTLISDPRLGSVEALEPPAPSWRTKNANQKPKDQSKAAIVIARLNRGKGASMDEICRTTKWQKHSTRAFLTGLRTKGFVITREQRGEEGAAYRITQTTDQHPEQAAS